MGSISACADFYYTTAGISAADAFVPDRSSVGKSGDFDCCVINSGISISELSISIINPSTTSPDYAWWDIGGHAYSNAGTAINEKSRYLPCR